MVKFDQQLVVKVFEAGFNWRAIVPSSSFVDGMGFDPAEISILEKVHSSGDAPRDTIYSAGSRIAKLKGIFCYDFLFWFADKLSLNTSDLEEGGRHSQAMDLTAMILEKLKG